MGKIILLLFLTGIGLGVYVVKSDLIDFKQLATDTLGLKFNDVEPQEPGDDAPAFKLPFGKREQFPFTRTLVDTQGRPLEATILGKSGDTLAVRRSSDGKEFAISLTKLGEADRKFFSRMADHGDGVVSSISRRNIADGRVARWNSDFENSKREAERSGLPIYLVFTGTSWCPPCQTMEKEVFSSTEFRKFANKNLVLMKVLVPSGGRNLRGSVADLAKQYGISSYPTVLLLDDSGKEFYKKSGGHSDATAYVSMIKSKLRQ